MPKILPYPALACLVALGFLVTSYVRGSYAKTLFSLSSNVAFVIITLGIALQFRPFRDFLQKHPARKFFERSCHSAEFLVKLEGLLRENTELNPLLNSLISLVLDDVGVEKAAFVLKGERGIPAVVKRGYGPEVDLTSDELWELAEKGKEITIAGARGDVTNLKPILRQLDSEALVPLLENDYLIGLLLLGYKKSRRSYSGRDVELLEILGRQSAMAIQALQFYEETQDFNSQLRIKMKEARAELAAVSENVEKLSQDKDEFIAAVAQHLGYSLSAIRDGISAAEAGGPLTERQRKALAETLGYLNRLWKLVDDLGAISRMNDNGLQAGFVEFSLDELIYHVLRKGKLKAERKGLRLGYQRPSTRLPQIKADPDKLEHALSNLVDNALNCTGEGQVVVEAEREDDEIMIAVSDSCKGTDGEQLSRLFAPLSRGPGTTGSRVDGNGLSLLVTKRIVEAHHGRMWIESVPGKGRTFRLSIPLT